MRPTSELSRNTCPGDISPTHYPLHLTTKGPHSRPGVGRGGAAAWAPWVHRGSGCAVSPVTFLDLVEGCLLLTKTSCPPGLRQPWPSGRQAARLWSPGLPLNLPSPPPTRGKSSTTWPGLPGCWSGWRSCWGQVPRALAHSCLCSIPVQGPLTQGLVGPVLPPRRLWRF